DAAGTYQILVSNTETGCTNTASVQVVQNQPVVASLSSQSNVSCFGGSNGAATALGAGGNNNFTYAWSNGGTGATITNLTAGIYIVSVTDGENCTSTTSATISEPELLAANATATGQTANGINDGTATANPSGGTAPFTYLWNNDATTQTITGLAPGNYSVVVTDANGCTTQQSVTVNSYNCALSGSIVGTDVTCFGANNGTATVSFVGGTEPFTYAWSNGETTASISGLNAGIYTVNVNDANNCPAVLSIQITTPNELLANAVSTNETGIGSNDGTATAVPTGGNGSYTYLWSNGETTQSISGLAPGSYTVQVTDGNNCIVSQTVIVNSYSCAISTDAVVSNVSCPSGTNGSVTMAITGGEAPFTYNWSNGGTTATISNLAAGVYTVSVTDANECLVVSTATVSEPIPFSAWEVTVNNTVCPNDPSGSASASISGGTEPYTFLWSNGATGNSISNVVPGVYSVQLTDANGCTQQTNATIVATDQEAPTASAEDATVTLDPSGNVSVSLAQVNAQFADNCTVASTVLSPNTFSCLNLGNNSVTLTVTDNSGLSTTVTINVKVLDNQAPTVTCPNDIVACSYNNVVTFQPATAEDNCLILNGQWNQTSGLPSGSTFPEGTTVQTFTFTDAGGNIGTCSFNVKINTAVAYDTPVVSNDHNGLGVGSIDITVHGGTAPYTYNWTLNGAPFATTQDLTGLNAGAYVVVVTDANGCSYASQEIVVTNTVAAKEPSWLSGVSLLPNPTSDQTKVLFAQPLNSKLELSVVDAMGRVLKTMYFDQVQVVTLDCTDLPSGVYTLRFRANQEIGARKLSVVK
ncbi:MAG: T9SS type A sorting domain-containing protein, partial [Saprospiraceae bacterium]|nr:T9SS type A sorting domain-containing protein [Saprospiraceae bacterium]